MLELEVQMYTQSNNQKETQPLEGITSTSFFFQEQQLRNGGLQMGGENIQLGNLTLFHRNDRNS